MVTALSSCLSRTKAAAPTSGFGPSQASRRFGCPSVVTQSASNRALRNRRVPWLPQLPDMGSPADAILSKTTESQIGRAIMRDIRASGAVVEDPQITEYINDIGHRLAAQTNDGDYEFTFFVVDDPNINAFALPGGRIYVTRGLLAHLDGATWISRSRTEPLFSLARCWAPMVRWCRASLPPERWRGSAAAVPRPTSTAPWI